MCVHVRTCMGVHYHFFLFVFVVVEKRSGDIAIIEWCQHAMIFVVC